MRNFRTRVLIVFTLPVLTVIITSNLFFVWFIAKYHRKMSESEFSNIAQTISTLIRIDNTVQSSSSDVSAERMNNMDLDEKLKKILDNIQAMRSVYLLKKADDHSFHVVAGAHSDKDMGPILLTGKQYTIDNLPGILMGSVVPVVLRDRDGLYRTRFMTGYVPVRDVDGKPLMVLRLKYDMATGDGKFHRMIYLEILGITVFLILLTVLFGIFVSKQISIPVRNLVEGIENVQRGNLAFRINVESNDEFGQLARTFNKMVNSLNASRKILHTYLYRTIRSMVSILEARDPYTKGHSERVAYFSEKIARKLELPEIKVSLLKEVALLHDIGKLGIEESILHKAEPLTEQEWNIIRKHPVVGKEILRPIFFEKEALEIVSQHHERFDGKGYPCGFQGNQINIMTQILAVADAFDAMISERAYRKPKSKSEAIRELKENSGTQFNPDIVKVFLQILEEEMYETLG